MPARSRHHQDLARHIGAEALTSSERRILIVEDSFLIAMETRSQVEQCGCVAIGPVSGVEQALAVVRQTPLDGALLDINLGDDRVWPVAELLEDRGIPFLLTTGYDPMELPTRFASRRLLSKPFTVRMLRAELERIGLVAG